MQAEAEVKQAKLKLERATIRAPYADMVAAKAVDIGQYVTVGKMLGETFAIDFAEVRLPLTKKDLSMMNSFSAADKNSHLQPYEKPRHVHLSQVVYTFEKSVCSRGHKQ